MPNNNREIFSRLPFFTDFVGGRLHGRSTEGDFEVAFTSFGEFAFMLTEQGDLVTEFPERGLTYVYAQEGNLLLAAVDIGLYLANMSPDEVLQMPNGGKNVVGLLHTLLDNEMQMYMTFSMISDSVSLAIFDKNGEELQSRADEEVGMGNGVGGNVGINESQVAFEVIKSGDGFMFALGERDEDEMGLAATEVSMQVDFEDDVLGDDPKRFQRLMKKIVLT